MCLKVQPDTVIYELRANSISNWLLHFVTGDKRAGHTLSPLNELNLPHKNIHPHSFTFTYSTRAHIHTSTMDIHTNAKEKKKNTRHKRTPQPINTRSCTLLTHYPELSYPPSHRPLTSTHPDFSLTRPPGSKATLVVWIAGGCWGPRGAVGGRGGGDSSHIPFGSLWSKGPGELKGGTLLKNTCDNDVIWALARPARQLLTVMM